MTQDVQVKPRATQGRVRIDETVRGDVLLLEVAGQVDEHFKGFGAIAANIKTVIIETSRMTGMTSFGVRQWLDAITNLPKTVRDLFFIGCPMFFVDQLNMVMGFGGAAKVLTIFAPYTCTACGNHANEIIDIHGERAVLNKGGVPERACPECGERAEFDETPEAYFAFINKYAPAALDRTALELLEQKQIYSGTSASAEKPPRILKIVKGTVTYFRVSGVIGSLFRSRPLVVGAEGEVVIDLAEVTRFDVDAQREWARLIKSLGTQVRGVTLVDVGPPVLEAAALGVVQLGKGVAVWSILVPYRCTSCKRTMNESVVGALPKKLEERVCSSCGGTTIPKLRPSLAASLGDVNHTVPKDSEATIRRREEMLSRAMVDAKVAEAGEGAAEGERTIGNYEIVRKLSAGGMAEVFLAKHVGIGGFEKTVALKKIQRQMLDKRHLAVDMFLNEAKIAARLTHPNIVQVLDVGEAHGALYLVMEYVRGQDFQNVFKRRRAQRLKVPLGEAMYIVAETALALHYAYWTKDIDGKQLSVVHRDVSPHNVIIGFDGSVKLLDFGVAMSSVTEVEAMVVGKWSYMSPEHTTNEKLDHRSDLFSLGVILYQICTGRAPFASPSARETVRKIREGDFVSVSRIAADTPPRLAELIQRLLAPDPLKRPQTGQQLASELKEIAAEAGLESSGPRIAHMMMELFPEEQVDGPQGEPTTILEIHTPVVAAGSGSGDSASGLGSDSVSVKGKHTIDAVTTPRASKRLSNVKLDSTSVVVTQLEQVEEAGKSSAWLTVLLVLGVLAAGTLLVYLALWS